MLALRTINKKDFGFYKELYQDQAVMAYVCPPLDDEQCKQSFLLLLSRINKANRGQWIINWEGTPVGLIDARRNVCCDTGRKAVEVGVLMSPLYQSRGWAKQAHQMLFEELKRLNWPKHFLAYCHKDNHKAHRLYAGMGFVKLLDSVDKNSAKTTAWEKK